MQPEQWFCFAVLGLTGAWVMAATVRQPGGILHLPFLATAGVFGLLGPQVVGVIRTGAAPWYAVCKFLVFSAVCIAALYLGWAGAGRAYRALPAPRPVGGRELRFFFWLGVSLELLGLIGNWKLAALVGGLRNLYLEAAGYALKWEGAPVIYTFFANYMIPGGILVAFAGLRSHNRWMLAAAMPALALNLASVILVARRTPLIMTLVVLLCLLYLTKRYLPPRWLLGVGAALAVAAVFALPAYRRAGGLLSSQPKVGGGTTVASVMQTGGVEFRDGCYLLQVTEEEGAFQYGLGFYNAFIRYYVPRALVGDEGKQRLLIDLPDAGHVGPRASSVPNRYVWRIDRSTVPTGPATVFQQFWYAGWVCYYLLALWLRRHWERAVRGDMWSQVAYTTCITTAIAAVTNDFYALYVPIFQFILPLAVLVMAWKFLHKKRGVLPRHAPRAFRTIPFPKRVRSGA